MKNYLSSLAFSLLSLMAFGQEEVEIVEIDSPTDSTEEEAIPFAIVERMPEIKGCSEDLAGQEAINCFQSAVMKHISKTLEYPKEAIEQGIQGRVFLRFVIEKDGSITNIEKLRGVHPLLDEAAIASIKSLEIEGPATQRGKPVRMEFMIPISFSFE